MKDRRLWLLLALACALRLLTTGWDSGLLSPHPDERQVAFVAEESQGLLSDPGFYAYGSLHFQAVRAATFLRGLPREYSGLLRGGRSLSFVASLVALALGWLVARRAWGRRTASLFLLLAAFVPLDLQQSHFATVEAHHAMWVMASLAACFWLARSGSPLAAVAAGFAAGASLAVKVASLPLGLALLAALAPAFVRRGSGRGLSLGAAAAAAALGGFWIGQPSAFAGLSPPVASIAVLAVASVLATRLPARPGWGLAAGGTTLVAVGAAAILLPPFNPAYLRGVGEQIAMVIGRSDLPYVRVYRDTLPVLYPLRELALWGVGPALLTAALAGVAAALRRLWGRWFRLAAGRWGAGSELLLILSAWAVPMALRLATLQVKYLRYWQPLVVPGALLAAWWLVRLPRRWRRGACAAAVAGTALWGAAYLGAFSDPHPHRTAQEWLDLVISPGQAVAFETWDERLPLAAVGPRLELPSYDLPDDEGKVLAWCDTLAQADWVVLTSHRVRRTAAANRDRFPHTDRLYRLLLAGEAGFAPLTRVERGPGLLGLRWPVQGADESFVNYEFPRVVILRRTAELDPGELADRVRRPLDLEARPKDPSRLRIANEAQSAVPEGLEVEELRLRPSGTASRTSSRFSLREGSPAEPLLEGEPWRRVEQRLLGPVPRLAPVPSAGAQTADLVRWLLVLAGLGAGCWLLLLPALSRLPDAGVGLALTSGWVLAGWLMWLGATLGLWPAGPETATWLWLAIVCGGGAVGVRRRALVLTLWRRRRTSILTVLAVFVSVLALFLLARALNPAIFWGEKPMDFTFLNAFLGSTRWPPGEPWMAGMSLHYYYLGEALAALPILIIGSSAAVGYNLMAATLPALAAALLAGAGLAVARRRHAAAAVVAPLLVLLSGNLAWPWLLGLARDGRLFDLWWATSRVIPGFAIDEYPLWTALFADLHAHFLALPVLLAALLWGSLAVAPRSGSWAVAATACGVGAGVLAATNPWDLLVLTLALAVGCVAASRRAPVGLLRLGLAALIAGAACAPFLAELWQWTRTGLGGGVVHLTREGFAPAWAVLRHLGLFLGPMAVVALASLRRRALLALPLGGVAAAVGYLAVHSQAAALAMGAAVVLVFALVGEQDRLARLGWALAGAAMALVAGCEVVTLVDRMNTLFKVYNGIWILLACALALLLLRLRGSRRRWLVAAWLPLQAVAMVNLPLGVAQGVLQPRILSPRPTLDGQIFLRDQDPQTWTVARALQAMARPGEVVAEAAGPPYRDYTRVAMHTGQPTVLGWEWHLRQRGQSPAEITARGTDLALIYAGRDPVLRRRALDRYRVRWVVLADVERRTYAPVAEDPLEGIPGVVRVVERGGASLYRVER